MCSYSGSNINYLDVLHLRLLQWHVLTFHVQQFHVLQFYSCIFMLWSSVRHFHVDLSPLITVITWRNIIQKSVCSQVRFYALFRHVLVPQAQNQRERQWLVCILLFTDHLKSNCHGWKSVGNKKILNLSVSATVSVVNKDEYINPSRWRCVELAPCDDYLCD